MQTRPHAARLRCDPARRDRGHHDAAAGPRRDAQGVRRRRAHHGRGARQQSAQADVRSARSDGLPVRPRRAHRRLSRAGAGGGRRLRGPARARARLDGRHARGGAGRPAALRSAGPRARLGEKRQRLQPGKPQGEAVGAVRRCSRTSSRATRRTDFNKAFGRDFMGAYQAQLRERRSASERHGHCFIPILYVRTVSWPPSKTSCSGTRLARRARRSCAVAGSRRPATQPSMRASRRRLADRGADRDPGPPAGHRRAAARAAGPGRAVLGRASGWSGWRRRICPMRRRSPRPAWIWRTSPWCAPPAGATRCGLRSRCCAPAAATRCSAGSTAPSYEELRRLAVAAEGSRGLGRAVPPARSCARILARLPAPRPRARRTGSLRCTSSSAAARLPAAPLRLPLKRPVHALGRAPFPVPAAGGARSRSPPGPASSRLGSRSSRRRSCCWKCRAACACSAAARPC